LTALAKAGKSFDKDDSFSRQAELSYKPGVCMNMLLGERRLAYSLRM
jgi:hypothetical protein